MFPQGVVYRPTGHRAGAWRRGIKRDRGRREASPAKVDRADLPRPRLPRRVATPSVALALGAEATPPTGRAASVPSGQWVTVWACA